MNEVAYWDPPAENPNFISRPPDPGVVDYLGTVGWDSIYHSPFSGAYRYAELSIAKTGLLNGVAWDNDNGLTTDQNLADSQHNLLSPTDASQKYGLQGQLHFDEPIREEAAQIMYRRKIAENDRSYALQSGATTGFRQAAGLGVGMAATLLDPINVAMMFVPVVGEARMAQLVAKFGGSMLKARLASGAIEGTVGALMAEPFVLLPAMQEQANYGLADSALNLGFGAALGAGIHAGLGAIGDRMARLKPKESNAIFESAMNDVLQDRPVEMPAKVFEFTDEFDGKASDVEVPVGNPDADMGAPDYIATVDAMKFSRETVGRDLFQELVNERFPNYGESDPGIQISLVEPIAREIVAAAQQGLDPVQTVRSLTTQMIEKARTLAAKAGTTSIYDRQLVPDALVDSPSINDIPLRDARGKFLSKSRRLELLNEKINADRVRGEIQQDIKRHDITQEDITRVNPDIPPRLVDDPEVTRIDTEANDLEAQSRILLEDPAVKAEYERLTEQIGDVSSRNAGVEAATDCIIRNLL